MSQWLQMAGVMVKGASWMAKKLAKAVDIALTPVMQAAERLIPQGANELGAALYTGSAYAPPGMTEHKPAPTQPEPERAPAPAIPEAVKPPPVPVHPAPSLALTAELYLAGQPAKQAEQHSNLYFTGYDTKLTQQAAQMPSNPASGKERER